MSMEPADPVDRREEISPHFGEHSSHFMFVFPGQQVKRNLPPKNKQKKQIGLIAS